MISDFEKAILDLIVEKALDKLSTVSQHEGISLSDVKQTMQQVATDAYISGYIKAVVVSIAANEEEDDKEYSDY